MIQIIADACSAARRQGLGARETHDAIQLALLARDPTLRPATARIIADQLFPVVERTMGH
ncbi:hypothetical protein [Magnetospirillum molischianum]|uniref:Uncharacterized protein n=1 Tax=Magnetospirillum molischianum DSM 120 TaxID=1150626 RepID=H8FT27_MAGML|nr:hypothetical protein [Magnetospirillum molischianum]CCG41515.1 conserved hypothetical protein [Magnetospirillum molischianum DSM 120]